MNNSYLIVFNLCNTYKYELNNVSFILYIFNTIILIIITVEFKILIMLYK